MTKNDDQQYIMNTYARFDVEIVSGKNATCYDQNGKRYIDVGSGIGVNSLGYCDEEWVGAVTAQAATLQHTSNLYYTKPQAELAKQLCKSSGYNKVFLCNSGAEANEGAIKLARKYSVEKYNSDRNQIICLDNSFHGRTITTLSATGQDIFHQFFFPFTEGFVFAPANELESVKTLISDKTCGIMVEMIQGEGGVLPLESEFVKGIKALCEEHDLCFIIDEVQTGIGRTGKLLAHEHYDIKADIVTLAKGLGGGLPIGAVLANEEKAGVLGLSHHGSTFGGNPVACAGGNVVLKRVASPDFLDQVTKMGQYFKQKLLAIKGVAAVRGMGMMIGVQLEEPLTAGEVARECVANGLLILTAKKLIRLLPPLTITMAEADEALAIFEKVMIKLQQMEGKAQ